MSEAKVLTYPLTLTFNVQARFVRDCKPLCDWSKTVIIFKPAWFDRETATRHSAEWNGESIIDGHRPEMFNEWTQPMEIEVQNGGKGAVYLTEQSIDTYSHAVKFAGDGKPPEMMQPMGDVTETWATG